MSQTFAGRGIQPFDTLGQLAFPAGRHDCKISRLRARRPAADVMFQVLPHVEDIDHVVAILRLGDMQNEGFLAEIDHSAQVERIVVGCRHVLGIGGRKRCRPSDLVERRSVAGRRLWIRYVAIFPRHAFHANERVAPDIGGETCLIGIRLQPGLYVFRARWQVEKRVLVGRLGNRVGGECENGPCQ